MAKFWLYFKRAVLVWGFIWLVIVITFTSWGLINYYGRTQPDTTTQGQQPVEVLNKSFADIVLKVTRSSADTDTFHINISKANAILVDHYELPTKSLGLDWPEITDAKIIPIDSKSYRVILYAASSESDHEVSHDYILLFKLNSKMNFVNMIDLADMHKVEGNPSKMFGNKIISLPYIEDMSYEQISIPTLVEIGDTIKIKPMLNRESLALIKQHFGKLLQERMEVVTKSQDAELIQNYKTVTEKFNEAITERVSTY